MSYSLRTESGRFRPKHVEFYSKNKFEKLEHYSWFYSNDLSRCTVTCTSNSSDTKFHLIRARSIGSSTEIPLLSHNRSTTLTELLSENQSLYKFVHVFQYRFFLRIWQKPYEQGWSTFTLLNELWPIEPIFQKDGACPTAFWKWTLHQIL